MLCYELLVGFSPFYSENPMDIYARVLASRETLKLPGDEGFAGYDRSAEERGEGKDSGVVRRSSYTFHGEGKEHGSRKGDVSDLSLIHI